MACKRIEKSLSKLLEPAPGSYAHCGTDLNIVELFSSSCSLPILTKDSKALVTLELFGFIIGSPSSFSSDAVLKVIAELLSLLSAL